MKLVRVRNPAVRRIRSATPRPRQNFAFVVMLSAAKDLLSV
jgi:hypothetical protein